MKKICSALLIIVMLSTLILSSCEVNPPMDIPLEAPTGLAINGTALSWTPVNHAIGYTVKVGDMEVNCNSSRFELAQLSIADGKYYVMVRARGANGYSDSDYSMAIEYIKGTSGGNASEGGNNGNSESGGNGNDNTGGNGGNASTPTIDTSLATANNRYATVNAPLTNNAPPLMASSTDTVYNYYLVDGGYIMNTPIFSKSMYYPRLGVATLSLTKEDVTSSAIEDSLEDTVEEAISETFDFSSGESCSITSEIGVEDVVTAKVGATATIENTRQWGTAAERRNSTSATHTVVNEKSQSFGQSISYTIGEHDEPEGHYRISIMATCDVYYLVTTSRDNSELISIQMLLCARDDTSYVLEYSENNRFNKTSTEKKLDLPDGFYKNYQIPTNVVHYKAILDVDGGYALDQTVFEPTMRQSYTLPVPTKYGYAFVGWYSAKNGGGTRYTDHNGNSCNPWGEYADATLYACWISTQSKQITSVNQLKIGSQQIESPQSAAFTLGFDIAKLKEIGFTALNISISGSCSGYDYKMNERGRYFVLRDAARNADLTSWQFQVKNFGGTGVQSVSLDSLDTNGHYTLRLISDRSDAYDEKLTVGGIVITITPVR